MIKTLYGLDKKGGFKVWTIEVIPNTLTATIKITHGKEGGKMTEKLEEIFQGKQGRNTFEQGVSEAEGRIKKQMDKNYRETKEELTDIPVLAMLAADYRKQGHRVVFPCYGSVKYDGVRALAKCKGGVITLESRTGQPYDVPHILDALKPHMQDGDIWDGEIYLHGQTLQDITSAVKRTDTQGEVDKAFKKYEFAVGDMKIQQAYSELAEAQLIHEIRPKLEFHLFDVVSDKEFVQRAEDLASLIGISIVSPFIKITQYLYIEDAAAIKQVHDDAVNAGYEGLMLRNFTGLYESGKRSADLQKYKEFLDEEFLITGAHLDKQGHIVFELKNNVNDETFDCVLGSLTWRQKAAGEMELYIGGHMTVQFQSRYKGTLLPQFPTGKLIRSGKLVGGEFVPSE